MATEPETKAWGAAIAVALFAVLALAGYFIVPRLILEREARSALAGRLRDPDSMQLRNLSSDGSGGICGEVNAKNAFGAYTGFSWFHYGAGYLLIDGEGNQGRYAEILCGR